MSSNSNDFANSYLGRLREKIGHELVHVPGASIVIENLAGEILLQKRRDFNTWDTPGGSPETGENAVQQAIREVHEETGLTALNPVPFAFASDPATQTIHYPNGDICHFHDIHFFATEYEGELIKSNFETIAVDWFNPLALPEVMPACTKVIAAYLEYKKTKTFQII